MLRRSTRLFKSFNQYKAEQLGITVPELLSKAEKVNQGAYSDHVERVKKNKRIDFLLDHCTPEE